MTCSINIKDMAIKIAKRDTCEHEFIQIGRKEMGYYKCKYCDLFTTSENLDNYNR